MVGVYMETRHYCSWKMIVEQWQKKMHGRDDARLVLDGGVRKSHVSGGLERDVGGLAGMGIAAGGKVCF